jgi:ABC-type lipoprotein export system ATPase subunit
MTDGARATATAAIATQPTGPVVQVRDVFVAYAGAGGSVMALRGSDLTLSVGERLLVLGPNGSGKSTLLRVMTGEQPVAAGTVVVSGTALHELNVRQRREWRARSVGFVDQFAGRGLLPELSVLDNVALQLRLTGVPPAQAEQRARAACTRWGIDALLERPVPELSGGEAQRVAVCAAVAHGPRLLLADEPTGELDDRAAGEVYDLIARIAADGAGVILVSHDTRAVASTDRVVRIRDGRAAEQWRPGSAVIEQLPDSRGWVRVPRERLPELDPVPPLEAHRTDRGLLLVPRAPAPSPPAEPSRRRPPPDPVGNQVHATLTGVAAGYGDRIVFDRLDLRLGASTWTAVTGPSGSGKSTLMAVLAGLLPARAGTVAVGDRSWADLARGARAEHRRRWLALLPQRPALLESLTVRENLQLTAGLLPARAGTVAVGDRSWADLARGARAEHRRRWLALLPQRPALLESLTVRENLQLTAGLRKSGSPASEHWVLEELADRLALARLLDQPVELLSGGERQRAALARALITPAPLLLLDEPTSQQDEASVDRIVAVLGEEIAEGRSVVTASHDPRVVSPATRVVELGSTQARFAPGPLRAREM